MPSIRNGLKRLRDAGLIYFSGGDPVHLAEVFARYADVASDCAGLASGASLAGCSAGAMAFGGKIIGIRRSHISAGLNLLPEIEVIPHYDKFLGWLPDRVTAAIVRQRCRYRSAWNR
jgi:cyanophycinase